MKKLIICFVTFFILPVRAEIVEMDKTKELFIDEMGLYRYSRAEEIYKKNCLDSSTEAVRKKCLESEKAIWERGKTQEEIKKQGTLFTGKIKTNSSGVEDYFYVIDGKKGKQIHLLLNNYYFENGELYDIKTEAPFTGEIVIGGVEGLAEDEKGPRYIAQQKYENGLPVGKPELFLIEK